MSLSCRTPPETKFISTLCSGAAGFSGCTDYKDDIQDGMSAYDVEIYPNTNFQDTHVLSYELTEWLGSQYASRFKHKRHHFVATKSSTKSADGSRAQDGSTNLE
jgi:hypothetical protein